MLERILSENIVKNIYGHVSDTAVVDYHLPFAENKRKFPVSVFRLFRFPKTCILNCCIYLYIYLYLCICCLFKRRRKAQAIFPIRLPFAHRANGNLSYVHLLTKKQMEFANGLNRLNGLAHLLIACVLLET
jgi:hypothetical protein